MNPGIWIIVAVLVVGTLAVLYGYLHDKRLTQERQAQLTTPPDRPIPHFRPDAPAPEYLSELEARTAPEDVPTRELDDATRAEIADQIDEATYLMGGYPLPDFVTDPASGYAVHDDPLVLVCLEPVIVMRELLDVIADAKKHGRPLVIVAPEISEEVAHTCAVNLIQRKADLLCVVAAPTQDLLDATGAVPVPHAGPPSGYVPATSLGNCVRWITDADDSWIVTSPGPLL